MLLQSLFFIFKFWYRRKWPKMSIRAIWMLKKQFCDWFPFLDIWRANLVWVLIFMIPSPSRIHPPPLSEKHPYLLTYDRYGKIFRIKFVAWSIRDLLSYVKNFVRTLPPSPILQIICQKHLKNRLFIFYIEISQHTRPYLIESKFCSESQI